MVATSAMLHVMFGKPKENEYMWIPNELTKAARSRSGRFERKGKGKEK